MRGAPLLGHLAGHGRERERDALNEEVGGSWWNCVDVVILEKIGIFGKWKSLWLWRKEGN